VARHLAQLNIATLRHPIDDPRTKDFADALEHVNALGEVSAGCSPTPATPRTFRCSLIRW
jgi:hypothetical protein